MSLVLQRIFPREEGYIPYLWLSNLIIPTAFLLREPPAKLWPGLALFALFILLYRELYCRKAWSPVWLSLQLAIVLILAIFYHPMYTYISFIMAHPLSKQKTGVLLSVSALFGTGTILTAVFRFGLSEPVYYMQLLPPLFGGCILPYIIRAFEEYRQMSERLQAATVQLERMAQQEERQRIARELHDTLGHTLSLISLKSELVQKLIAQAPDRAISEAHEIRDTARAALKQMRELVTEMKAVRLYEEYEHAKSLCAAAGIAITFTEHCAGQERALFPETAKSNSISAVKDLPLSSLQETILAMCFRESLTNIVRHSRAGECKVELEVQEGSVHLTVKDNGIGFQMQTSQYSGGNGLTGLKQRLSLVDGSLSLKSAPNEGTQLTLTIPRVIRHSHKEATE